MSTIQPRAAAAPVSPQSLADRLDAINEFDREPVTPDRLQGPGSFIGLYAGEHLAGAAVGLPVGMAMPKLDDVYPDSVGWVLVVVLVGTAVTALAILGFEKIAAAVQVASPWMFMVFVAAAVAVLPKLGVTSVGDFWRVASERIWTGAPAHGVAKFSFWHIMFFAWFCNMAMHIGMADMTVLRYAKRWQYGVLSGCGMYLGHFVAWIASGVLCAAALGDVAPGPIAYLGAGMTGIVTGAIG